MTLHTIETFSGELVATGSENSKLSIVNYVWDTDTLSWVRQSQGSSGGITSNVNVLSTTGLTDSQLRAAPLTIVGADKAVRVEDLGTTLYIAKAALGTVDASSAWQIKRITFSGSLINTHWANGNSNYTNTWDARASYTYY